VTDGDASDAARTRAEARLHRAEQQRIDAAKVRAEVEAAAVAQTAKTARLRTLRLAKEAEDRAAREAAPTPAPRKRK
jgi:hypothetical protein